MWLLCNQCEVRLKSVQCRNVIAPCPVAVAIPTRSKLAIPAQSHIFDRKFDPGLVLYFRGDDRGIISTVILLLLLIQEGLLPVTSESMCTNRVPTVREKSVKNEKSSRSGKSQGILIWVREILNFGKSQGKIREFHDNLSYFWMLIITVQISRSVCQVRCGTWLYWFLIYAPLLTLILGMAELLDKIWYRTLNHWTDIRNNAIGSMKM